MCDMGYEEKRGLENYRWTLCLLPWEWAVLHINHGYTVTFLPLLTYSQPHILNTPRTRLTVKVKVIPCVCDSASHCVYVLPPPRRARSTRCAS